MNLHYQKQSGMIRKYQRTYGLVLVISIVEGLLCWALHWNQLMLLFIGLGLGCLIALPRVPQVLRRQIKRQASAFQAGFGNYELSLLPTGINVKNPISESLFYLSAVEQLVESETHLFIQFSSAVRITIPKRTFSTQEQGFQFLRMAEEYRQAATGTPIPTMQRGSWWTQGTQVVEPQSQRQ
ncbi:YcxB family protein [Armatimonas sp.]|uniref:YcxB family protein n=1 Tax=Armatimonas sp. TaxID=1872638 RepID=UPI00286A3268|nr:YcxB family protein [Armatimonas sp.]